MGRAFVELFADRSKLVRGLKLAKADLQAFGGGVRNIGMKMVGLGAMAAAPFVGGIKAFANFDEKMANVSTMLDEPDKWMGGFRSGIKSMSVEFGKSTDDLAAGLYDILSASVPPAEAMERLAAGSRLAVAGTADVKDSVGALNSLMETYGDSFTDAGDASDFLFGIVKRGRTDLTQLAPKIGAILQPMKQAGFAAEEMGASIALVTRATGETDMSLTALKSIAMAFLKSTKEAKETWKELTDTEFNTQTLKDLGFEGVLKQLKGVDPETIANIFPNSRSITGILPALDKMTDYAVDMQAMANRAGNVDVAFGKMSKNASFKLTQLKNAAVVAFIAIGEAFAGPITKINERLLPLMASITEWISKNKELVLTVAGVVAGVIAAGIALVVLGTLISAMGTVCGVAATAIGLLLTPFGLVSAAIVGLGIYFAKNTQIIDALTKRLGPVFKDLKTIAVDAFGGIMKALKSGDYQGALDIVAGAFKDAWQRIAGDSSTMVGSAVAYIRDLWTNLPQTISATVSQIKISILGWIADNSLLASSIKGVVAGVVAAKLAVTAVGIAAAAISTVVATITGIATAFAFLLTPIGLVSAAVVALVATVAIESGAMKDIIASLGTTFVGVADTAKTAFGGIKEAIAAGDLEAAFRIASLGIQVVWQRIMNDLGMMWRAFMDSITEDIAPFVKFGLLGTHNKEINEALKARKERSITEETAGDKELANLERQLRVATDPKRIAALAQTKTYRTTAGERQRIYAEKTDAGEAVTDEERKQASADKVFLAMSESARLEKKRTENIASLLESYKLAAALPAEQLAVMPTGDIPAMNFREASRNRDEALDLARHAPTLGEAAFSRFLTGMGVGGLAGGLTAGAAGLAGEFGPDILKAAPDVIADLKSKWDKMTGGIGGATAFSGSFNAAAAIRGVGVKSVASETKKAVEETNGLIGLTNELLAKMTTIIGPPGLAVIG